MQLRYVWFPNPFLYVCTSNPLVHSTHYAESCWLKQKMDVNDVVVLY